MRRVMDDEFDREQQDAPDATGVEQPPAFWGWLWGLLRPRGDALHRRYAGRLRALDDAVAIHPEAASNYVLRGEIYLKLGEVALAAHDFEQACAIIDRQIRQDEWGLVAQSLQDRALIGLETANQHMQDDLNDPVETGSIGEATDFDARV